MSNAEFFEQVLGSRAGEAEDMVPGPTRPLTLRFYAREASEGVPDDDSSEPTPPPGGPILTYRTAGRGQNGESSN